MKFISRDKRNVDPWEQLSRYWAWRVEEEKALLEEWRNAREER